MVRRYSIFLVTFLVAAVSLALFFLALVQGWFGPFANKGSIFCERMHSGLIKQPANTWSNLGFVAAGLAMAWLLSSGRYRSGANLLTRNSWVATAFCVLAVLLGPGSMAMHASATKAGAFFDVLSMYLIAAFLVAFAAVRLFRFRTAYLALIFAVVLALQLWVSQQHGRAGNVSIGNAAFGLCVVTTIAFEVLIVALHRVRAKVAWGAASVAAVTTAFVIWNLSLTGKPLCVPDSWLQGHAAWHLLDALAVYCLFRYYVSQGCVSARQQ